MQFTLVVVGTLIGLLSYYRLMIQPALYQREISGITRHIALIQGGLNKPIPPRVPRLTITLSSSESVARSSSSLI